MKKNPRSLRLFAVIHVVLSIEDLFFFCMRNRLFSIEKNAKFVVNKCVPPQKSCTEQKYVQPNEDCLDSH